MSVSTNRDIATHMAGALTEPLELDYLIQSLDRALGQGAMATHGTMPMQTMLNVLVPFMRTYQGYNNPHGNIDESISIADGKIEGSNNILDGLITEDVPSSTFVDI